MTYIECSKQPTILYHKAFIDFLIKVSTRKKMALIEVKNPRISCNLHIRPRETAQVLREAQIILLQKESPSLLLVLTNSIEWSFGLATLSARDLGTKQSLQFYMEIV